MKISIIGAGRVGSATAFSILHNLEADEIVLIDILKNMAEGEALDLSHAAAGLGKNTKIFGGDDFSKTSGSDFVVITAGRGRKQGETREQLFDFNKKILEGVCTELKKFCPDATIIVVTNPSSEMTALAKNYFQKVIGMENQLDTARAKIYISQELGISQREVKSFVSGGHGESMKVEFLESLTEEQKKRILENVKNAGAEIIAKRGTSSYWGIAVQVSETIKNISGKSRVLAYGSHPAVKSKAFHAP